MGVPKFYRWISERYPCLSEVVKEHQVGERGGSGLAGRGPAARSTRGRGLSGLPSACRLPDGWRGEGAEGLQTPGRSVWGEDRLRFCGQSLRERRRSDSSLPGRAFRDSEIESWGSRL